MITKAARYTFCTAVLASSVAQAEPFTYQGSLNDNGAPANGEYDIRFELYDAPVGGTMIGGIQGIENIEVTDGIFTAEIDFGPGAFDANSRYLRIGVRPGDSGGLFTFLDPRTPIHPSPKADHANTADTIFGPIAYEYNDEFLTATLDIRRGEPSGYITDFGDTILRADSTSAYVGIAAAARDFGIYSYMNSANIFSVGLSTYITPAEPNNSIGIAVWDDRPGYGNLFLGGPNYIGNFGGTVSASGGYVTRYGNDAIDLVHPIAYGFVNFDGVATAGTPNFSVVYNATQTRYEILIDDEDYYFNEYVTIITPAFLNRGFRVTSDSGRLIVQFTNSSGAAATSSFQFATFRPSGVPLVSGHERRPLAPLKHANEDHLHGVHRRAAPRAPVPDDLDAVRPPAP